MLLSGERQVAPTLQGIRRDHVARYEFAARRLPKGCRAVDLACGIGYGTRILAEAGHRVTGVDRDKEAIAYARDHYSHRRASFCDAVSDEFDAAVSFETIEHIEDPLPVLAGLKAKFLLASVPNEDVLPYGAGFKFHFRHYTKRQFEELLNAAGWHVCEWWGQQGTESEVERERQGRTIIAVAKRGKVIPKASGPEHVAIVGLGPSAEQYMNIVKRLGSRKRFCDETWGINALGDVLCCDRIFHMDDVRVQEIRAKAAPESNIAAMLGWMKKHPGPIVTSFAHKDYPGLVEFPLEDVANSTGYAYFNSTAAYAVALAVHLGVRKLSVFGNDFTYPNAHHAEKGRACVEFWLGLGAARGMKIAIPRHSSLMDACHPISERLYGYDATDVHITDKAGGGFEFAFTEKALLTAEEYEERYDHTAHPNALVQSAA